VNDYGQLTRVAVWRERQRVRQQERDKADRMFAAFVLGLGTVMNVHGVGLAWPEDTPASVIEEARGHALRTLEAGP
jgi:hypothetical protein